MNKFFGAIALTIVVPAMAHAQAVTAAPKAGCCDKMKDMAGCKDMAKMDLSKHDMKVGADPHAGHVMSKPATDAPQADAHKNHQ